MPHSTRVGSWRWSYGSGAVIVSRAQVVEPALLQSVASTSTCIGMGTDGSCCTLVMTRQQQWLLDKVLVTAARVDRRDRLSDAREGRHASTRQIIRNGFQTSWLRTCLPARPLSTEYNKVSAFGTTCVVS